MNNSNSEVGRMTNRKNASKGNKYRWKSGGFLIPRK